MLTYTSVICQEKVFADFTQFEASGKVHITFQKSSMPGFSINEGTAKDELVISEGNNTLKIGLSPKGKANNNQKYIVVYYAEMSSVKLQNEARGTFDDVVQGDNLDLFLSRNSTLKLKAEIVETISAEVNDMSKLTLDGKAQKLILSAKNQSSANAKTLIANEVVILTENNARAEVFAEDKIKATSSNGGSITYSGSPKNVVENKTLSGGNITKL